MIPDATENALADHLRRRSSRVVVRPGADALDAVVERAARLGRRRRARRAAVTGLAAAVVAIVGVALVVPDHGRRAGTGVPAARTSGQPSPSTSPPDPAAGSSVPVAPPLPFDQLPPTDDEIAVRAEAAHRLIGACLDEAGFADRPFPDSRPSRPGPVPDGSLREAFGVFDEAEVRERGYRPQRWDVEAQHHARIANGAAGPTFTEQYGADLLAAWAGCQATASQDLRGGPQDMASVDHPVNVVGRLQGEAYDGAEADDRIAAVVGAWSACMAGRGYDFAHPLDPVAAFAPGDPAAGLPATPPAEDEVAAGLADVACKAEVGFAATWYAVLAEHQQALIDSHPAEIAAAAEWHAGFLARAQAVLAGATPSG